MLGLDLQIGLGSHLCYECKLYDNVYSMYYDITFREEGAMYVVAVGPHRSNVHMHRYFRMYVSQVYL